MSQPNGTADQSATVDQSFLKNWLYAPLTQWQKAWENLFHPQLFIGCNIDDEDTEKQVLNDVGSYGKQISVIDRVLEVLIAHPPSDLTYEEQAAIAEFVSYVEKVNASMTKNRGPKITDITPGYMDRLGQALLQKQKTNENDAAFASVVEKLAAIAATTRAGYQYRGGAVPRLPSRRIGPAKRV